MRHFMIAVAAAAMLGSAAAQAAEPSIKGHQPGAREHLQPSAHRLLADSDGSGADVQANPNVHHSNMRRA